MRFLPAESSVFQRQNKLTQSNAVQAIRVLPTEHLRNKLLHTQKSRSQYMMYKSTFSLEQSSLS
jgi:hypothetical protein